MLALALVVAWHAHAADPLLPIPMVSSDEPGEPLVLRGTVYAADGATPLPGASLYIYHTDASGAYSDADAGVSERNPRLHCRVTTDKRGRYAVRTILPGRYPGGRTPRHIHIIVTSGDGAEQNATFSIAEDLGHAPGEQAPRAREDTFSSLRPAERTADGVLECVRDIRMRASR